MGTITACANTIQKGLDQLYPKDISEPEQVIDALADLQHLCCVRGYDFDALAHTAREHVLFEQQRSPKFVKRATPRKG